MSPDAAARKPVAEGWSTSSGGAGSRRTSKSGGSQTDPDVGSGTEDGWDTHPNGDSLFVPLIVVPATVEL